MMPILIAVKAAPRRKARPMRLTKEQAASNRQAIVEAAGRLFRERGFDAVSVADLMDAAGFTHGGFYNHFASKEALAAEVTRTTIERGNGGLRQTLAGSEGGVADLARYLDAYLAPAHRDDPSRGCPVAALATDAGRQGDEVQAKFAEGLEALFGIVSRCIQDAEGTKGKRAEAAARAKAMRLWSEAVGALMLARAVGAAAPELSLAVLEASRVGCTGDLARLKKP